ncbi:MAG: SPFH domain-containing protein [Clostridia bacterium]
MGLIKAAVGAIGSTLQDQWKEAIRCDDMSNSVLMQKKTTKDGVISNKSTIIVAPGQVAIVYDNGRVIDATAEEGIYTFDDSSTPSFFAGQFGAVFKEMWERFTYDGASAKQQAVFFFNTKEILDNKFGTPAPVPYKDWDHPIMNARTGGYVPMRVEVKCFGKYTFKIENPAKFMSELAGTADIYTKEDVVEQMRAEVVGAFSNVLNGLGEDEYKIGALSLPSKADEIKKIMDEKVFDEQIRNRGLKLVGFIIESVTLDDESEKKIDAYEIGGDVYQQKGTLTSAYAEAVQSAAENEGGAMNGFMGLGMMNMSSGGAVTAATSSALAAKMPEGPSMQPYKAEEKQVTVVEKAPSPTVTEPVEKPTVIEKGPSLAVQPKKCSNCGHEVLGKFCPECGTKVEEIKKCKNCGKEVEGKFCAECGEKVE